MAGMRTVSSSRCAQYKLAFAASSDHSIMMEVTVPTVLQCHQAGNAVDPSSQLVHTAMKADGQPQSKPAVIVAEWAELGWDVCRLQHACRKVCQSGSDLSARTSLLCSARAKPGRLLGCSGQTTTSRPSRPDKLSQLGSLVPASSTLLMWCSTHNVLSSWPCASCHAGPLTGSWDQHTHLAPDGAAGSLVVTSTSPAAAPAVAGLSSMAGGCCRAVGLVWWQA